MSDATSPDAASDAATDATDAATASLPGAAEPRWLSAAEQDAWRALVGVVMWLPGALETQLSQDAGVTHFEYVVMSALSEAPDRALRMSALAARADAKAPRLSQVVGRLETRGWVRREPDPTDGRSTLAVLTDAGLDKVRDTAPGHVERVRELVFDHLSPTQVAQLTDVAARIVAAVEPGAARDG